MCSQPEVSQWLETYILLLHFTDYSFLVISYAPFCFLCQLWSVFSSVLFFACVFSSFPVVSHRGTCISAAHVVLHSLWRLLLLFLSQIMGGWLWLSTFSANSELLLQALSHHLILVIYKRDLVILESNIKIIFHFCITNWMWHIQFVLLYSWASAQSVIKCVLFHSAWK